VLVGFLDPALQWCWPRSGEQPIIPSSSVRPHLLGIAVA